MIYQTTTQLSTKKLDFIRVISYIYYMNIWIRLKNLWKLSEYEPSNSETEKHLKIGDKIAALFKSNLSKSKQATIVDMSPPVDLDAQLEKEYV